MNTKIRILYVEDDPEWQQIIIDALMPFAYQLDIASTSKEAMYRLKRTTYHVALLDKRLAEHDAENQDGLALAEVVADLYESTSIIIYTSFGDEDDMRHAFKDVKVWDFVGKNKPISEIIKSIRTAADNAQTEFNRPTWRMPLESLAIKDNVWDGILSYVKFNDTLPTRENIDTFAKYLLSNYRPLLTDKSDARLLNILDITLLNVRFWSKALGAPIVTWLGKKDDISVIVAKIDTDIKLRETLGIEHKVDQILNYEALPFLGGVIFKLGNAEFEEFNA